MDSHSLHEFMIRYGRTLSSTPEFMSYQRVYAAVWPILAELIIQLEGICAEYAVPLVVVDGKVRYPAAPDSGLAQHPARGGKYVTSCATEDTLCC